MGVVPPTNVSAVIWASLPVKHTTPILFSVFITVLFLGKVVYAYFARLLSKFPSPRVAAFTKLYEAYHALIKNDWLENLESIHRQYGM